MIREHINGFVKERVDELVRKRLPIKPYSCFELTLVEALAILAQRGSRDREDGWTTSNASIDCLRGKLLNS